MHYFIDHLELTTVTDQFGPDINDPATFYNVTSRFQLTNKAKAFASQSSMMIVQQSNVDFSLVNVILKPIEGLSTLLPVKYFVYRGILKSGLINGINIVSSATTNNELIKRIWSVAPTNVIQFNAGIIGFDDNTFTGTDNIETIYDFSRASVRPILVKEGEWFGDFTKDYEIGFEIILESDRINVDLNYVRAEKKQVDVTGLANLTLRAKREEILSFIDPASFFGLHYDTGINISTYMGNVKTTVIKKQSDIYTLLLDNKFATKNRVYFDIRSEKGYSYNFYQNFGDINNSNNDIKVGYENVSPTAKKYADVWPITFIDAAQPASTTKNNIRFNLRIDDNFKPIIYLPNKNVQEVVNNNPLSSYIKDDKIVPSQNPTDWSDELKFIFPNTAGKDNVAYYIRIYYFRQEHNSNNFPATVLRNEKYYDSAFCSVDLQDLGNPAKTNIHIESSHPNYISEKLQTNGTGNFGYASKNGAYWDTERILFYSTVINPDDKPVNSEKFYLNTDERKLELQSSKYSDSLLKRNINTICREYVIGTAHIGILGINSVKINGKLTEKENTLFLGLSIAQLTAIKNSIGLSDKHNRYIFLEPNPSNPLFDNTVVNTNTNLYYRYHEYTVKLQGLDANGNRAIITPQFNSNNIIVYSRDNQFFHSADFSFTEVIPNAENKIEFHIFDNGIVKTNDNIDLSLVRKTNDPANATDLSLVQDIFYLYHANGQPLPIPVCQLPIREANKLNPGVVNFDNQNVIPTGYGLNPIADYTPYNAQGVSARYSYENANHDIFTIGSHTRTRNNVVVLYSNYKIIYTNRKKKTFLVDIGVTPSINNNNSSLGIDFSWVQTRRFFGRPELIAAFIGALVDLRAFANPTGVNAGGKMQSTGFAFENSSCFPSQNHVNGNAIDTRYRSLMGFTLNPEDQLVVDTMHKFGFKWIIKCSLPAFNGLLHFQDANRDHDTHLHSEQLELRNRPI